MCGTRWRIIFTNWASTECSRITRINFRVPQQARFKPVIKLLKQGASHLYFKQYEEPLVSVVLVLQLGSVYGEPLRRASINLNGKWQFKLDPKNLRENVDETHPEAWFLLDCLLRFSTSDRCHPKAEVPERFLINIPGDVADIKSKR